MKATDELALFCTAEVMKAYLPMTRYLFEDHWLVSARTRLTFALVYLGSNQPLVLSVSQKAILPQISFTINAPFVVGRSHTSQESNLTRLLTSSKFKYSDFISEKEKKKSTYLIAQQTPTYKKDHGIELGTVGKWYFKNKRAMMALYRSTC